MRQCKCDYCASRGTRRDFRHGAVDEEDFVDVLPYKKYPRNKKYCKKSKAKEACDFTKDVVVSSWFSKNDEHWHYFKVKACSRCGKQKWETYRSFISKTPIN